MLVLCKPHAAYDATVAHISDIAVDSNLSANVLQRINKDLPDVMSSDVTLGCKVRVNPSDNTKFDIVKLTDANNQIKYVDNFTDPNNPLVVYREFADIIGISATKIAEGAITYIALDGRKDPSDPNFVVQNNNDNYWQYGDFPYYIQIGSLVHSDRAHITYVSKYPYSSRSLYIQMRQYWTMFGRMNDSGNVYGPNGANLKINRTAGKCWAVGINSANTDGQRNQNLVSSNAATGCYFYYARTDGTGTWGSSPITIFVDPNHYDTLNGLATVNPGKWTVQLIYFVPDIVYAPSLNLSYIVYGQRQFDNYQQALYHYSDPFVKDSALAWSIVRGWLIVKQGATSLSDPDQAIFIEAPRGGLAYLTSARKAGVLSINGQYDEDVFLDTSNIDSSTNRRYASDVEKDAMDSANVPTGSNPFATMNDIPVVPPEEIVEANSPVTEAAAFAAGARIVIRVDLL